MPARLYKHDELRPITVTVIDVCRLTGLGRSKIYELITEGRLTPIKIDKRTLIAYDEVVRFIEDAKQNTKLPLSLKDLMGE